MKEAVIFEHRKDVGRVIFMSAPHRGSNLATVWFGRLASALVRTPKSPRTSLTATFVIALDRSALKLSRMPNSIDTLAPTNRFVLAVNKVPLTPGIPYHSIIGDRGRGDTPNSSDGVVPYWSSHLDGAEEKSCPAAMARPAIPRRWRK